MIEDFKKLILEFYVNVVSTRDEEGIKKYFMENILPHIHPEFEAHAPDYRKEFLVNTASNILEIILDNKK